MSYRGRVGGWIVMLLLLCVSFPSVAQGGTGSISGAIREVNGVTPVNGVRVLLSQIGGIGNLYQMVTGANGQYQFPAVLPGQYTLCTSHDRYVTACYNGKLNWESGDAITLTANSTLTNINVVVPRKVKVSGRVYAPNGTGVKASLGRWLTPDHLDPAAAPDPNNDGTFTLYFDPGTFWLSASHSTYGRMFYGGALTRANATPITASAGQELTGIDIHFAAPGSLTGVITEATLPGAPTIPIQNATVFLSREGGAFASTQTDAAGVYQFFNLPNNIYRVGASAPGYTTEIYNDIPTSSYAPYITIAPNTIQTANLQLERTGRVTGTLYAMDGVTRLPNRYVRWQTDYVWGPDICTNSQGTYTMNDVPLNAIFYVYMAGLSCTSTTYYPAEYWDNAATAAQGNPLWVDGITPRTGIDFVMNNAGSGSGGEADAITDTTSEDSRSSFVGSINGTIYAPDGVTPVRASINLYRVNGDTISFVRAGSADIDGSYQLFPLNPGNYVLKIVPHNYLYAYSGDQSSLEDAIPITLESGAIMRQIDFIMNPGAEITGMIIDGSSGLPALYPAIRVVNEAGQEVEWGGSARHDGTYQVIVPPGRYSIFADNATTGAGRFYGNVSDIGDAVFIDAALNAPVTGANITIGRRGEVIGTVYAPDGVTRVANALIRITQPGMPFSYTACTNTQGIYRHAKAMIDVPNIVQVEGSCNSTPFPYLTEYWNDAYDAADATPVTLTNNQRYATGIDFTLNVGGSISGTLTGGALPGSTDEPTVIANGIVEVYKGEVNTDVGELVATIAANADGTYMISGLVAGHYRVRATAPEYVYEYYGERFALWDSPPVSVAFGTNTTGIDIELDPAVMVSGTVYASDSITPLENVPISFYAEWYDKEIWCTDAIGAYTIDKAPSNAVFTIGAADDRRPFYDEYLAAPNPCDPAKSNFVQSYLGNETFALNANPLVYQAGGETNFSDIDLSVMVGGRINATIERPNGTPYQSDVVYLRLLAEPSATPIIGRSDENGIYTSSVLRPDTYQVTVYFYNLSGQNSVSQNVTVTAGTDTNITMIVTPAIGTGSISGTIYEPDGVTPIQGVFVSLERANYTNRPNAVTDENGHYQFTELPAGTYTIRAINYKGYFIEYYDNVLAPGPGTPITLAAGENRVGINIVFNGNITISGRLIDEVTGLPVTREVLVLAAYTSNTASGVGFTTGLDGIYEIILPTPGTYTIRTLYNGNAEIIPSSYRNPLDSPTDTPITVTAGQTLTGLDIIVPRGAEIIGRATNAFSGEGIAGLFVLNSQAVDGANSVLQSSRITNSDGYYWHRPALYNAQYYLWTDGNVEVPPASSVTSYENEYWQEAPSEDTATPLTFTYHHRALGGIDFTLVPPGTPVTMNGGVTLQGRPTAPDENWIAPLRVVITPTAGGAAVYDQIIQTDENGVFTVSGLAPGRYEVWVKGESTLANIKTVTLAAGPTQVTFGILKSGDANGDNLVTLPDFSILANTFGKLSGEAGYDGRADFNGDNAVTIIDFSLLASNFGQSGVSP